MSTIAGWFKVPSSPITVVARGRLYSLTQHYVPALKSSAACMAPSRCVLCEQLLPVQQITTVPVSEPGSDRIWLLRILASQERIVTMLQAQGEELCGVLLELERLSERQPWRIGCRPAGRQAAREVRIEKYLSSIGKRAYAYMAAELAGAEPNILDT